MSAVHYPFSPDISFNAPGATLETPVIVWPDRSGEVLSPFAEPASGEAPPKDPMPDPEAERRQRLLRKSPGYALLTDSILLLKAYQLDMDVPPRRSHYLREQLAGLLQQLTGASLNPDQLHVRFTTRDRPSIDMNGKERYARRFSLTEIAQACFEPLDHGGLAHVNVIDAPLTPEHPSLSASTVLRLITQAPWRADYETRFGGFWGLHRATYRTLSRLSFLDQLARQLTRKQISASGYRLALDALGLDAFPDSVSRLEHSGRGTLTEVWGLSVDGVPIPGVFQVRSKNTSHCFIHIVGTRDRVVEYISEDSSEMTRRLVRAVNRSGWHRRMLDMLEQNDASAQVIKAFPIGGDVFDTLTTAQIQVTRALLGEEGFDRLDILKPVARVMTLASVVKFWPTHFPVLDMIPEPSRCAAQLMRDFLSKRYGLMLDPDHVFIVYRHGKSRSPLGDPRRPTTSLGVPSDKPVSLSEALMTHYQVQHPQGYIDHGGRTLVYLDTTGKGVWSPDRTLPIDPAEVEQHIRQLDFLTVMSGYIADFWEQKAGAIESAFCSIFIRQALVALKKSHLTRAGFDQVVRAIERPEDAEWTAIGLHVQGSALSSLKPLYPGLLILEQPGQPRVLYQAGHSDPFVELQSEDDFHQCLQRATADKRWREALMRYTPRGHHDRLDYLLKVWAKVQHPIPPVSLLRPWTDILFNTDTHRALANAWLESRLDRPPFNFLREVLRRNALEDAQASIVTTAEVSIRYWSSWLSHLRILLAPLSILLTPAFVASLAVELGDTALSVMLANLPGERYEEKKDAVLSVLSLGLLSIGPRTPRITRSLSRITRAPGRAVRAGPALGADAKVLTSIARRITPPRQTRLEKFFHTEAMLKRWTIAGHPRFGNLPVHAWKLGRRFLLWTSDRGQARTLVVSSHGYYMPWNSTVRIPLGTEIHTYAPHGYVLTDPRLHRVVNRTVRPFAISSAFDNTLVSNSLTLPPLTRVDKIIAGTELPGRMKNYTLSKFQSLRDESYDDVAHIVRHSNASPFRNQLPATPMDVLTVRNRFGMSAPTLADLFDTLYSRGIHYDKILLVHCRCAAIDALLNRALVYPATDSRSEGKLIVGITSHFLDAVS